MSLTNKAVRNRSERPVGERPVSERHARRLKVAGTCGALILLAACFNSYVFDIIDPCEVEQTRVSQSIEPSTAADILIVVDNSGSMCEEQQNLIDNFYNANVAECPLADPAAFAEERFQNPAETVLANELSACGFIQILAAYDNDFRVGVITTDIGQCDNRFGWADSDNPEVINNPGANCSGIRHPDWGRRPQGGCLQAPSGWDKKFLDRDTEDVGVRFQELLDGVRTFGSSFERGLDAVKMFLDPQSARHPDCEGDLNSFIRDEASLLVVFLSDEDDCSHAVSENFPDENVGESCVGNETPPFGRDPDIQTLWCYDRPEELTPVTEYVNFLKNFKTQPNAIRVAVIAGATREGGLAPAGCRIANGSPDGQCTPSFGSSNVTRNGARCDPAVLMAAGLPPCCEADAGGRYYDLANAFPENSFTDSICFASFRSTMIQLAKFAAKVDSVTLPEPPAVPAAIQVEIQRADGTVENIERIADNTEVGEQSGWQLSVDDNNTYSVNFYGDAVPQPGDDINVFVLGEGDTSGPEAERCIGFSSAAGGNNADAGG